MSAINTKGNTTVDDSDDSQMLIDISKKEVEHRKDEKILLAKQKAESIARGSTKELPKKANFLFTLLFSLFASQLMFLNISTFLPQHIKQKGLGITQGQVGIILAMYQISRLFLSTVIGSTLHRVGKKNYIIIGFFFMMIATLGFLSLYKVDDSMVFFGLAIAFRFI